MSASTKTVSEEDNSDLPLIRRTITTIDVAVIPISPHSKLPEHLKDLTIPTHRTCKACGEYKPLSAYKADIKSRFGKRWQRHMCKECAKQADGVHRRNKRFREYLENCKRSDFEAKEWNIHSLEVLAHIFSQGGCKPLESGIALKGCVFPVVGGFKMYMGNVGPIVEYQMLEGKRAKYSLSLTPLVEIAEAMVKAGVELVVTGVHALKITDDMYMPHVKWMRRHCRNRKVKKGGV